VFEVRKSEEMEVDGRLEDGRWRMEDGGNK
jgi:hypothetical protein